MTSPAALLRRIDPALATLFAVVFVNMAGFGLVIPLLPFFAESLGAPAWQITLMFSAYSLGQFFAEPYWGRLSDRIGRKPVLLITTVANVAGYAGAGLRADDLVGDRHPPVHRPGRRQHLHHPGLYRRHHPARASAPGRMGMVGAAFGLGFIVGPGIGGLLTREGIGPIGYQIPLFAAAGLAALASLGVVLFLKESRAKADPAAPRPARSATLKDAAANPVISRVLLVTLIYMGAFSGMESTFALWAKDRFGWGAAEVGCDLHGHRRGLGDLPGADRRPGGAAGSARPTCWSSASAAFGLSLLLQTLVPRPSTGWCRSAPASACSAWR